MSDFIKKAIEKVNSKVAEKIAKEEQKRVKQNDRALRAAANLFKKVERIREKQENKAEKEQQKIENKAKRARKILDAQEKKLQIKEKKTAERNAFKELPKEQRKALRQARTKRTRTVKPKVNSTRLDIFKAYVANASGKTWFGEKKWTHTQEKTKTQYEQIPFPEGFMYMSDFAIGEEESEFDDDLLEKMMNVLDGLTTSRKQVYVLMYVKILDKDTEEISESTYPYKPQGVIDVLKNYQNIVKSFQLIFWRTAEIPVQGACDSRPHEISLRFEGENDKILELKVATVKSTGDNCLINALSQANATLGKAFRAQKIREELQIPAGAIASEDCERIAQRLDVTFSLYRVEDSKLILVSESETRSDKHADLLASEGHYYKILSDIRVILGQQTKDSMQIQEAVDTCEKMTDRVVTFAPNVDEQDLECVNFSQQLENPTFEDFLEIVESKKNILLVGAGGCGKTWLLKKLSEIPMVKYTATTACAADLLSGTTIQSYIIKNRKPSREIMVVDEVSMMGSLLFEQLYEWANKGKAADRAQLILSGDFLQLPPVNDRFFFQASSFFEFAKNAIMIKLTEVKRQENRDQAAFLNNLREGITDWKYIHRLTKNQVRDPQLVLSAKKNFVAEYNEFKLKGLGYPLHNYEGIVYKPDGSEKKRTKNQLCVGAKAIITKNMILGEVSVYNGQRVTVTDTEQNFVQAIDEKGKIHTIPYTNDEEDGKIIERYLPVEACYALTIHKSQGQTVSSAVVHVDGLFEEGMAYVALSRVSDLKNLQISDKIERSDKGWQPNAFALEFYKSGKTISADQMLFIPDTKKQLKNVRRHAWKNPNWNHIYIDFETYVDGFVQKPYFNHLLHQYGETVVAKKSYFDQLWDGGERCDVAQQTFDYCRDIALSYGDNLAKLKQDKSKIALVKKLKKEIPTLIGYNLSGFDLHFLVQKYLNDPVCSARFKLNMIYKGTSLIFFQVFDRISQEIVLRTHDAFQIVSCSLSEALTNFCGSQGKELVKKIEFKDEIMHIYHNYASNPSILKPKMLTNISKKIYTGTEIVTKDLRKQVCLFDEVIRYAENDTNVLPVLYKCLDELTKNVLDANVTDFLTAGSISWYGFVSNLPEECTEVSRNKHSNKIRQSLINTKLYRAEKNQEEFVRSSIKGGRVCPRQHTTIDGEKYVYLDISGMYASIMSKEILPYGKAIWMDERQTRILENTVRYFERSDWRGIYEQLTKRFGLFIAEVDFEENPHNLEPVIQFKENGKTKYTLERRTDTLTSIDIALIINSGGKIFQVKRVLSWESNTKLMSPWIDKCNTIKKEGEIQGNGAKKSFGKLLGNGSYGQTLKRDRNEIVKIVSTWNEADEFVNRNKLTDIFQCGEFDVLRGEKIVSQESFITSRCSFIGAFILAYTRGMTFDIFQTACPNRYNEKGIWEQILYGDTDSLVMREWQANLLVKAGWVQKSSGKLTDELADTKSHWFLPERLSSRIDNLKMLDELPFVSPEKKQMPAQQDWVWANATDDEKRDPANFKFWYVTKGIFSAAKSYACKYTDHYGVTSSEKVKFKGIPASALVNSGKLDFNAVEHAYQKPGSKTAVLQGKPQVIKTFTKSEGSEMFSQVVDSNMRRGKPMTRILFKTVWQGRQHLEGNENITVPWGWVAK